MRCRCTGSWRRGLVAGSAGGEREGTAKNRPRHYPQRGQAGAGASAAGACRAATAGIRQGGRWELRNGRRLRSAKQALAGTSAERATAREAGKIFENRKQSALGSSNLPPPPTRYTWTFFPVFWSSISPILALDFPPPLSSFSSFLSLFPILSAPPSAVLPPPPFSHPVIFY